MHLNALRQLNIKSNVISIMNYIYIYIYPYATTMCFIDIFVFLLFFFVLFTCKNTFYKLSSINAKELDKESYKISLFLSFIQDRRVELFRLIHLFLLFNKYLPTFIYFTIQIKRKH